MRWVQSEYALKGLFLGLLLYTALQIQIVPAEGSVEEQHRLAWEATGRIALYMAVGLGVGVLAALLRQFGELARACEKNYNALTKTWSTPACTSWV